ncbi:hypothetical protein EGW08_007897, partial [Elysia chlorotica]
KGIPESTAVEKRDRSPPSGQAGGDNLQGSWSERAFAASRLAGQGSGSDRGTFRTPDASPRVAAKSRDLQVSWSERRLASPLSLEEQEQQEEEEEEGGSAHWKLPRDTRRFRRKADVEREQRKESDKEEEEVVEKLRDTQNDVSREEPRDQSSVEFSDARPLSAERDSETRGEGSAQPACPLEVSSSTLKAMRIEGQTRTDADSRLSGGFEPSLEALETDQQEEELKSGGDKSGSCTGTFAGQVDGERKSSPPLTETKFNGSSNTDTCGEEKDGNRDGEGITGKDSGFDPMDGEKDEDCGEETNKSVGANGVHKYQTLLIVIRDLLVDYLTGMAQVPDEQDGGAPIVTATMKYLDQQCSRTELGALARCVGDGLGLDLPEDSASAREGQVALQRLLGLCDRFRALHLMSVLRGGVANGTS